MAQDRGQCRITGGPDLRRCPRLRSWTAGSAQVSADLGRAEGTLAAIQEATGIYWELAAARPDRFRADLSGAASGRPLTINLVSRRRHRHILLATSSRPNRSVSAAHVPFQATSRRNLGLEDAVPPRTVTVWESIDSRQAHGRAPPKGPSQACPIMAQRRHGGFRQKLLGGGAGAVQDAGGGADVHVEGDADGGVAGHAGDVGGFEVPAGQGGGAEHVPQAVPGPGAGAVRGRAIRRRGRRAPGRGGRSWRTATRCRGGRGTSARAGWSRRPARRGLPRMRAAILSASG